MARDDDARATGATKRLRRMSKPQRRAQLIARALAIVDAEGSEALTLARLAQECGVTKPIAYQHFGTRSGLMIALYRELGDGPSDAAAAALRDSATGALSLTEALKLCAKAYIETALDKGTLYTSISAALMATAEMENCRQLVRAEYVMRFQQSIAPLVGGSESDRMRMVYPIFGAGEALAEGIGRGSVSREDAIETFYHIAVDLIARHQRRLEAMPLTN